MRGDTVVMQANTANRRRKRYFNFLTGIFFFTSCFTLLYFFVFTESYAEIDTVNRSMNSEFYREQEASVTAGNKTVEEGSSREQVFGNMEKREQAVKKLLPCGIPVGIYLETKGVLVTEVTGVSTAAGKMMSPCSSLIEAGDYILQVDQTEIMTKEQFRKLIQESKGNPVELLIEHNGKQQEVTINPVLSDSSRYMAGLWIRDNMHGIGTLTWLDENGNFAALGHCISDIDTGLLMEIDSGQLYHAEIYSLIKGSDHQPGSLAGAIDYRMKSCIGTVNRNTEQGIFGSGNDEIRKLIFDKSGSYYQCDSFQSLWEKAAVKVAASDEIRDGKAQMLSSFSGEYRFYEIEIRRVDEEKPGYGNINLEVTITDRALLDQTGGILQGMSGSPIIQDGKLVGAVTHVLVNSPDTGYGIFIENMLEAAS